MLRQAIERLSLMLDEWPSLMKLARDALRGPPSEMPTQLRVLRSMLPRMPDAAPSGGDHAPDGNAGSPSVSDVLGGRLSAIWSMLCASRLVEQRPVGSTMTAGPDRCGPGAKALVFS